MDKYINIGVYQLNEYYKKGYKLVQIYTEYCEYSHSICETSEIRDNYNNIVQTISTCKNIPLRNTNTFAVMELTKEAEALYGQRIEIENSKENK